jgi:hypothetical protein
MILKFALKANMIFAFARDLNPAAIVVATTGSAGRVVTLPLVDQSMRVLLGISNATYLSASAKGAVRTGFVGERAFVSSSVAMS